MSIHENLPKQIKKDLPEIGWAKAVELVKVARSERDHFDSLHWARKAQEMPKEEFRHEVEKHLNGEDSEPTFLAGAQASNGDPQVLLNALLRSFAMLEEEQKLSFLTEVSTTHAQKLAG